MKLFFFLDKSYLCETQTYANCTAVCKGYMFQTFSM